MMHTTESTAPAAGQAEWTKCPGCGSLLYRKRLDRNLSVCPECEHHVRMGARARIDSLVDRDSFRESVFDDVLPDPLEFVDSRSYSDRLVSAHRASRESEAVVVGTALLGGRRVVLAVMEFSFMGGSMGLEVGRRVSEAAELALRSHDPLIVVCASGGARMQEGVFSLLQMARTAVAFARLREAGVLSVCVLTDPTYGGVSASFASLGSVVIAERGAHVGFAGPRVVRETIHAALPADFQAAESQLRHGLIDRVEDRADLRSLLQRLAALHSPRSAFPTVDPDSEPEPDIAVATGSSAPRDPWEVVQAARCVDRPTASDYLRLVFDDVVELHGDRASADDPAVIGGVASIGGRSVVVIGTQKGHTVKELVAHNFGMAHPEGYRKAMRLMAHAESFGLPVVTFVDTPGAHPGPEAEEHGQSTAIAETILRSSRLRVPVVAVITGEGGSGGALALSTSDRLLVLENAFLSVISPEGCAAILWRSAASAPDAARALRLGAGHLLESGVATSVVPEPSGGAGADPAACARTLRAAVVRELDELRGVSPADLLASREERFRRLDGSVLTAPLLDDLAV
ncbi:acetyl-CoA carboxylase carboxyl transferase subunit beta [Rathayibacter sp. VKM Ac-2759]|uniref:acetyl-CoA carboxylase carboxyltransferase subunit alpha/beta n=1 Tax=Rathayibacter sp. VKM Ac-2759 TaxID=2609252 RepID=UPI001317FB23|nr:acetyl-CoA carboxylase carboxyltransferase subunit alpha/beta [Rathayibacter sp. VKM Ac-2759]QHC66681.1 acetyl-CoA carboxylase carboxyl transferase subunit beta [Rathayibacter sp. VKM Ac-2759]